MHANPDIITAQMVTGTHFRWGFFTQAMIVHTRWINTDVAVAIEKTGHRVNHKRHRFIPDPDPATNWAIVDPPEIIKM